MQYDVKLTCPHCDQTELHDLEWAEDLTGHQCGYCNKKYVFKVQIKEKIKYYTEVK